MNNNLTKKLIDSYPSFFPPNFIFECDDGWFKIIDDLLFYIKSIIDNNGHLYCFQDFYGIKHEINTLDGFIFTQIKEKFGRLTFYYEKCDNNKCLHAIYFTEFLSLRTCEVCGKEGKLLKHKNVFKTTCQEHEL